jgi:hypothetical protein
MDLIKLNVSASFILDRTSLTWRELLFGIDKELISPNAAMDFAANRMERGDDSAGVVDLATSMKGQGIRALVEQLANMEPQQSTAQVRDKWLYLVLAWIFAHRKEYGDPLRVVEEAYADFDYPQLVAPFVRYMPMTGLDRGNREENEQQLYENWERFIRNMEVHYGAAKS